MEHTDQRSATGIIRYQVTNAGSKSEAVTPVLDRGPDAPSLLVMMQGDNPFENQLLRPYEGCEVEVQGTMSKSMFIIDSIKRI